jgi:dTDP-4-amino-4,6-dideoxygalactose transaminase
MFDAAHAFDCTRGGRPIGGFGRAEVFSFHGTKFFNTFEGGAIATDDDELAATARLMRNFGFSGYDNVIHPGTNGKMPEVCAAMGLVNLNHLDGVVRENRRVHRTYTRLLREVPGISVLQPDATEQHNHQYVVLEVDPDIASRDALLARLHSHDVLARRYFWPGLHRMEPYASRDPDVVGSLSLAATERVAQMVLVLPTGPTMSDGDIARVVGVIKEELDV